MTVKDKVGKTLILWSISYSLNAKMCTTKHQENNGIFNVQFHKSLNIKICNSKFQKLFVFSMFNFIKQIWL